MTLRVLLIGERMNMPCPARWANLAYSDPTRWLELSLRLGCMGSGLNGRRHDGVPGSGERRLRSIGLRWTTGLNLLPPSAVIGDWDERGAMRVADTLGALHETAMRSVFLKTPELTTFTLPDEYRYAKWVAHLIVILGRRAEAAMTSQRAEYFEPVLTGHESVVRITVPHPSGRNRWWNSDQNRATAGAAVSGLLAQLESGLGPVRDCRDDGGDAPPGAG